MAHRRARHARGPVAMAVLASALLLLACDDEVPGDPVGDAPPAPAESAPDAQGVIAGCEDLAGDLGAADDASLRDAVRDRPMVDVLADLDDLQLMASSLRTLGDEVVPAGEPLTLFAPLDAVLLPDEPDGDDATDTTELPADALLGGHTVVGEHELQELDGTTELELLDGSLLAAETTDGEAVVQRQERSAVVVCADLEVADGVLHVIDDVLVVPTDGQTEPGGELDTGDPSVDEDGVRDDLPQRLDEDDVGTGDDGGQRSP